MKFSKPLDCVNSSIQKVILLLTITFTLFACKKSGSDEDPKPQPEPEQIASAIDYYDLQNYYVVQVLKPKSSVASTKGTHPLLVINLLEKQNGGQYSSLYYYYSASGGETLNPNDKYDSKTGITKLKVAMANLNLSRDKNQEIIIKDYTAVNNSSSFKDYDLDYIQLVKLNNINYGNNTYFKSVNGDSHYGFYADYKQWIYNANAKPSYNNLSSSTWTFTQHSKHLWYGQDNGSQKLRNSFLIIPKGNGWKGEHKDKELLLINTLETSSLKAIGPLGLYHLIN